MDVRLNIYIVLCAIKNKRLYLTNQKLRNNEISCIVCEGEIKHIFQLDVCLSVHRCLCVEKKNQLDVTECFIALTICPTCFGHFYVHHQGLEIMCVITAYGVQCLVAGCRGSGTGKQAVCPGRGRLHD